MVRYKDGCHPIEGTFVREDPLPAIINICGSFFALDAALELPSPAVVTLASPLMDERAFLLERVCQKADEVFPREMPSPQFIQPALF